MNWCHWTSSKINNWWMIFHETMFVPIGTSFIGYTANLYCFTAFLGRILVQGACNILKQLLRVLQGIKDLLCFRCPSFDTLCYLSKGLYPMDRLEINVADDGVNALYINTDIRHFRMWVPFSRRRAFISGLQWTPEEGVPQHAWRTVPRPLACPSK